MSTDDLRWLIGIAATIILAFAGMLIGAFRSLSGKIDKGNESLAKATKEGDDQLHERINRVKDEYVRRVDLDQRLSHIEATQSEMRGDVKAIRDTLVNRPRSGD